MKRKLQGLTDKYKDVLKKPAYTYSGPLIGASRLTDGTVGNAVKGRKPFACFCRLHSSEPTDLLQQPHSDLVPGTGAESAIAMPHVHGAADWLVVHRQVPQRSG